MNSPGVADATTWPSRSRRTVGGEPSPQSIVTVCESSVPGSVNWPFKVIVSLSLAIGSDRLRSAAVNCGATLLTVTLVDADADLVFLVGHRGVRSYSCRTRRRPGCSDRCGVEKRRVARRKDESSSGRAVAPVDARPCWCGSRRGSRSFR